MQLRSALRLLMIAVFAAVAGLVYWQWRPAEVETPEAEAAEAAEVDAMAADTERGVESVTSALNVVQSSNGRPVLAIRAGSHVDFVDGWNEWDGVELVIYGARPDDEDDDVMVIGERMRTAGEIGRFNEVRLIGAVSATLPGGGHFETRRLDYDAVTGLVSNCNRNALVYAGMDVRSDCLEFRTGGDLSAGETLSAKELRMWGNLVVRGEEAAGSSMPPGLRGGGEELRFVPGDQAVTITGTAMLEFDQALVRARQLQLDVGREARELRGVDAQGEARLRYRPEGAAASAAGEADDEDTSGAGGAISVRGDRVRLQLGDDSVLEGIEGSGSGSERVQLGLPGIGTLEAMSIELQPATAARRQLVQARGNVGWGAARDVDTGMRWLRAEQLQIESDAKRPRQLSAQGQVESELVTGNTGQARRFGGEALEITWGADGALASGTWPEGVRFSTDGRELTAATATYATDGSWTLAGKPRPAIRSAELSIVADTVKLAGDGALTATGEVTGRLGGDVLSAAGALFGAVESVEYRSGTARLDDTGLDLGGRVEIVWGERSLVAGTMKIETDPGRLRAGSEIELVAKVEEDDAFITVTAQNLLVEEESAEIRVAGQARLRQGERNIQSERMTVEIDPEGGWHSVLAEQAVRYRDPQGEASGAALTYDLATREMLLTGSSTERAIFRLDDIEYSSAEALRVRFDGENVVIESTEAGRTRTSVVPRTTGS